MFFYVFKFFFWLFFLSLQVSFFDKKQNNLLKMNNIAIFASGSGSNAQAIVEYFRSLGENPVKIILSNNKNAFVIERAKTLGVECIIFNKDDFYHSSRVIDILKERNIDFIVLAGFLWLIPNSLIDAYANKIINIHPALLPKYGGKGMYGMHVHEAVVQNKEAYSGITIHFVDEKYDNGAIIFQAQCKIEEGDTAEMVAQKVHQLEYAYFPKVVRQLVLNRPIEEVLGVNQ